jgi:hypothetical protein
MLVKFVSDGGETLAVSTPSAIRQNASGSLGRIATLKVAADDGIQYQVTVNLTVLGTGREASAETKAKYAANVTRARAILAQTAAPTTATIARPDSIPDSVWSKLSDTDKAALVKAMTP